MSAVLYKCPTTGQNVQAWLEDDKQANEPMTYVSVPSRFQSLVDVRRFGVGERVVPQSYSQSIFEATQAWMHERHLFDVGPDVGVSYAEAVRH